ncbi:putative hydro-lyase [Halovulum dunhuangense]|uniref:Putative hydro-lyase HMH01_16140 n=1 Tax=Halovulum dunhuangense TaxID=1505036 RepID=A0A849L644_9RHOB|nr:putative hydro-lyase [Halovulum dunhuangense]NNU81968.1 putative hydro-lyase [Halovulum dunhuangense]
MRDTFSDLQRSDLATLRAAIRGGAYRGHTAGLGAGYLQANVVILPEPWALDFMRFCQRNPKPCPLVGVSETGDPVMRTLGRDIDIRSDLPAYNIYRDGRLAGTANDIADLWTGDMVAFALGCSFTFEHALIRAGIPLWHVENDTTVPMFRSSIPCAPAGPFRSMMVVSLRALDADRVDQAVAISRRYPLAHGGPVHAGDPSDIGIADIARPDWGDPAPLLPGQVPVFWACGVTPQAAIAAAAPPLCITHRPGHMLITDIPEDAEVPVLAQD